MSINTDLEFDFWPWTWKYNGKECNTFDSLKEAWLAIDHLNDPRFNFDKPHKYATGSGYDKSIRIASNVDMEVKDFEITDKISLKDYQQYALEKFDKQMEKLANKYKKLVVGISGGIDSTMVYAWLHKNKCDYESFLVRGDLWRGFINESIAEENALNMVKLLGNKNRVIRWGKDMDSHQMIKDYIDADHWEVPASSLMTCTPASQYNPITKKMFPIADLEDAVTLTPIEANDLWLHKPSSWSRFIPDNMHKILTTLDITDGVDIFCNYGYKIGAVGHELNDKYDWSKGRQVMNRWEDDLMYIMMHDQMRSAGTSFEWFKMWHSIDDNSCSDEQLKDLMGCGWLYRTLEEWVGDGILPYVKSVYWHENPYVANDEMKKYLIDLASDNIKFYKEHNKIKEIVYWDSVSKVLHSWGRLGWKAIERFHTVNWLRKNS